MTLHVLREVLIFILPLLGVTLLGNSVEEATATTSGTGKMLAQLVECTESGTLEEIHLIPSSTWAGTNAVFLGIAEDNAGTPGTILASKESAEKPKEKVAFALSGFSVALTKGTKYWLICLNSAAGQSATVLGKTAGTSTVRASSLKVTKIEATTEWLATQAKGLTSFWGTGTVGGAVISATAKASAGGQASVQAQSLRLAAAASSAGARASVTSQTTRMTSAKAQAGAQSSAVGAAVGGATTTAKAQAGGRSTAAVTTIRLTTAAASAGARSTVASKGIRTTTAAASAGARSSVVGARVGKAAVNASAGAQASVAVRRGVLTLALARAGAQASVAGATIRRATAQATAGGQCSASVFKAHYVIASAGARSSVTAAVFTEPQLVVPMAGTVSGPQAGRALTDESALAGSVSGGQAGRIGAADRH